MELKNTLRKSLKNKFFCPFCHKGKSRKKAFEITIVQNNLETESFCHLIIRFKSHKYFIKNTICQLNFGRILINIWKIIIRKKKHLEKPLLSLSLKNRTKSPYVHVVCKLQYAPVVMYPKNYTKTPYKHIISKIPYIRIISKLKRKKVTFFQTLWIQAMYIWIKWSFLNVFSIKNAFQNLPLKSTFSKIWLFFFKNKTLTWPMKNDSGHAFFHIFFQKAPIIIFGR